MKRLFVSIFILALPVLAAAQSGGSIAIPIETFDFGKMKQMDRKSHEFVFFNQGDDTLRLADPKASCGCTAILLTNYNIAPGDSGTINVTFTAVPGSTGPVEKHIYVNGAGNPPVKLATLTIKANVVGEIAIDRNYIRYSSKVGETEEIKIHVTSMADEPLTLDNVSVGLMEYADTTSGREYHSGNVRASPVTEYTLEIEDKELAPGEETDITLGIPSREKGQINGSIRIALPASVITVGISGVISRPESE